jgi:gamma-glutamyltranspeptidase/glutathione hydrolase
MLARGLFLLHTRGGRRPFEEAMVPAEQAARFGIDISRAFAQDLAAVAGPLFADPWAASAFGAGPGGRPPAVGERLVQPDLGATLSVMRTAGVGDLYQGGLARRIEEVSPRAGAGLTVAEMRTGLPRVAPPMQLRNGNDLVSFAPDEGGLAAAASYSALMGGAGIPAATSAGLAAAQAFRVQGGDPARFIATAPGGEAPMPPLPASATVAVVDREGMAVTCAFTMNNLFGTGRVLPGTGILLAAAPGMGRIAPPLLAGGIAHNPNLRAFRAMAAGSGQEMAGIAAAVPLAGMLRGQTAQVALSGVPDPGRAVAIGCTRYMPGSAGDCTAAVDPRGAGLASGGGE